MPEHMQPMSEAMYYILLALLKPVHGYGMMQRVKELSGGRVLLGPGTLYGVLNRMKKDGWITLAAEDVRRKTYAITDLGREALQAEYRRICLMVEDGKAVMEQDDKEGS